ncbi:dynein heavy chain, N-terminal region 1-domain-containing protein, partial [Endogone sp. FLAS-F59071]
MDEEGVQPSPPAATNGDVPGALSEPFDPVPLKEYLEKIIIFLLAADASDLESSLFAYADTLEKCKRFATDQQSPVLYILKEREAKKDEATDDTSPQTYNYTLSQEITYLPTHVGSIVLMKRSPTLDLLRPLGPQLQCMPLPGAPIAGEPGAVSPYEALHSYIHLAVSPYFNAYVSSKGGNQQEMTGKKNEDNKMGIPMAKKKIAELELSLLHLQQNVEIPEISLNIHPFVQRAVEKCREQSKRVTVDAVDPQVLSDSAVLNKLQGDVNGWIKEIQKVTKLSRDPTTGTAIQEVNFWLSMERALEKIDEQLRSDQIMLTLDILKHAKRFHATVGFIADTGLKESTEQGLYAAIASSLLSLLSDWFPKLFKYSRLLCTVRKYNQLMKDFPLNELLSATDLDKIKESLLLIFGHLNKKLKLVPYPIRRALPLVEAISHDLNDQLLKVLGSRRLMYMEYDDFEKATAGAVDVFRTWDDQIKEFTNVARDVTRKFKEKFLPIRFNSAHAKLQERVTFVRAFRKQHEQLHQTIVRVMTDPKGKKAVILSSDGVAESLVEEAESISISDINSVEEVKHAYESVKNIDVLEGTEIWVQAETTYNERVSRVENQIIARLRDRLGTAKNANEMFRVFSKFNALFVRPKA